MRLRKQKTNKNECHFLLLKGRSCPIWIWSGVLFSLIDVGVESFDYIFWGIFGHIGNATSSTWKIRSTFGGVQQVGRFPRHKQWKIRIILPYCHVIVDAFLTSPKNFKHFKCNFSENWSSLRLVSNSSANLGPWTVDSPLEGRGKNKLQTSTDAVCVLGLGPKVS